MFWHVTNSAADDICLATLTEVRPGQEVAGVDRNNSQVHPRLAGETVVAGYTEGSTAPGRALRSSGRPQSHGAPPRAT